MLQGAAAVPGVNGGVRLDEMPVNTVLRTDGAVQGADHTGRHRVRQPERVTDGDHGFSDHEVF